MLANLMLALLLAAAPASIDPLPATATTAFMDYLESIAALAHGDRSERIRARYRDSLASIDLASVADADMENLLFASITASGLSNDSDIARHSRAIFDEMASRTILEERHYGDMQTLYMNLRDFDTARAFHAEFAGDHALEEVPADPRAADFNATKRSILVPEGMHALRHQNFDMPRGDFVLVVADPLCHFTRDAVTAIQADPQLHAYFLQNARWMAPYGVNLDPALVATWNSSFPGFPLVLVDDIRSWPDVDFWGTPTFYVFAKGRIVRSIRGWPREGRADELKAALGITQTGP